MARENEYIRDRSTHPLDYSGTLNPWGNNSSLTMENEMKPQERNALVVKISLALAAGKDSGGYDTLLDMYAHTALKVIEDHFEDILEQRYSDGFDDGVKAGHFEANSQRLRADQQ